MKNNTSRTDAAWTNLRWSAAGILFNLIFGSFSRKIFVLVLGREFVGLSSLIGNITAVLSLLDFGAAGAVIYRLYAPLAKNDICAVSQLLACYRRVCVFSAFVTAVAGFAAMQYLPDAGIDNAKTVFIIYIVSNSLGFLFSPERALIFADRRSYVGQIFAYAFGAPGTIAQCVLLMVTKSYTAYVAFSAALTFAEDAAAAFYIRKKYPDVDFRAKPTQKGVFSSLLTEMLYSQPTNIASTLLRTFDNFLVVWLFGVAANGVYSNYNMLLSYAAMLSVTPVGAVAACVGNLGAASSKQHAEQVFRSLSVGVFFTVNICTSVLFVMSDDIITLWLGPSLALPQGVSFAVALAFFISGMRKSTLIFRDAFGLYKKERIKPFAELAGFLALTAVFGKTFGMGGVYLGQAASAFFVCLWYEPWVLYRHGFSKSVLPHYMLMLKFCAICAASCVCSFVICRSIAVFSLKCAVCCAVPSLFFAGAFFRSRELSGLFGVFRRIFCR